MSDVRRECGIAMLNYKERTPAVTNAALVRALSIEKLAEAFANSCPADNRNRCCQYFEKGTKGCRDCWLDWLKSPADKEETE
jgi:hypothetical protein